MTKKPFKSKKKKNFDPLNSFDNLSKKVKMLRREASPVKEIMHFADPEYIKTLGINTDELISFAGGWVNHKAPEKLREAYETIVSDIDLFHSSGKYSSTLGEKEFKTAISLFEKELYKMDISEKQIAVGTGSTQLAMELFNVILDPGDKILLLDPSYCNYPTQLLTGVPDVEILRFSVMDEKEWKFIADEKIEEFSNYIRDNKPKIVMLVSPDNPTSKILSDKFVKAALNAIKEINGFLIIDFAYKELIFETVNKHSRCVIVSEEPKENSFAQALAGRIQENCFSNLDAPVSVIGAENVPAIPLNSILEERYLPNTEKVSKTINDLLSF